MSPLNDAAVAHAAGEPEEGGRRKPGGSRSEPSAVGRGWSDEEEIWVEVEMVRQQQSLAINDDPKWQWCRESVRGAGRIRCIKGQEARRWDGRRREVGETDRRGVRRGGAEDEKRKTEQRATAT